MMKKLPKSQLELEFEVAWENWSKYLDQAAGEASQELKIAGFRPGKAPRNLIEQKIGKEPILNNAAEKAVKKSYVDYILKEKLEVIGSPKVEISEIEEGKSLKFKAVVSVMPVISIDAKYKEDIKKINADYAKKDVAIKDEEIDLELEKLANSRVKLVTVMRPAQKNDSVEIDFEVLVENVPIENGTSKKHPLIIGRGVFIPGFEEQIIGMSEGEVKEFSLPFPEDYHKKDLAGKMATFKVKVNLVQERQTPEINDEFVKSLGKFSDLAELRKNVREGLEHENQHKMVEQKRGEYIEKIVARSTVDLPEILIEEELKRMLEEFEYQLSPMGMNLEQYLEKIGKDKKELTKDWRGQAEKRVISALALKEIAKMEEILATSEEVEQEMNKTFQYYKNVKDMEKNIDMERLYSYSKGVLENEKVFEMLEKI